MERVIDNDKAFLRLNKGEDLFSSILEIANKESWPCAHISGIGAVKDIELGYYELDKKNYARKKFPGIAEALSLDGNLSFKDGKRFLHLHGVFSGPDYKCFGGHLFSANVAVTCEINVRIFKAEAIRHLDQEVGIGLVHLCSLDNH